ncbi:FAD:protein FMN transferase [Halioglobus maricola]|uniref:FAD:protein FMN transferase n=1 Tax=Halioglobus maricola TaxID=2601894 RepID=A0A5P9NN57_9GAMM|nr:FAD:protein FMN transferase [Halioglobus maricola]QFU77227.1 FAD:protein FMN transferase [Halioglobus maricola]
MVFSRQHCRVHIVLLLILCACRVSAVSAGEWLSGGRAIMGTEVRVELWADDADVGRALQAQVFAEFERLDTMMSPWKPASEISRVNREAARSPQKVSAEMFNVVLRSLHYSQLSNGAFDISFAAAGQHYDYRSGKRPERETLKAAQAAIDFRSIVLDAQGQTIAFARPGMALDLGGIAKGYAVDRGISILVAAGITSAVVSAGGDSRILGDMGDRPRMIGVRHPREEGEYAAIIPLVDTAVSTSGDYERFFEEEGVRYHHILDPATGESADGLQSATVIAPLSLDCDALSTTVFVLGIERGLALVNSLEGVDAILIDADGKLHYSDELLLSTTE